VFATRYLQLHGNADRVELLSTRLAKLREEGTGTSR
jgi:hypothetical protein